MDYLTISAPAEASFTEQKSKFLSFIHPVDTADEAKAIIKEYAKRFFDARHVCWAYMIGADRMEFQSSDNGEPSGTAGKPILGQINSFSLTNVVVVVVRYFGGIKLGTSGLIAAYRQGARLAIEAASIESRSEMGSLTFTFPYMAMNDVMKVVKSAGLQIQSQQFDNTCSMTVALPTDNLPSISRRIADIDGVSLCE
jgi:YigZ family protein